MLRKKEADMISSRFFNPHSKRILSYWWILPSKDAKYLGSKDYIGLFKTKGFIKQGYQTQDLEYINKLFRAISKYNI